jgi:hypothetical protein
MKVKDLEPSYCFYRRLSDLPQGVSWIFHLMALNPASIPIKSSQFLNFLHQGAPAGPNHYRESEVFRDDRGTGFQPVAGSACHPHPVLPPKGSSLPTGGRGAALRVGRVSPRTPKACG